MSRLVTVGQLNMDETWVDTDVCGGCGSRILEPIGKRDSFLLILGDEPGTVDIDGGYPFAGSYGAILESELHYIGIRMRDVRRMYVWPHVNNKKPECFSFGLNMVLKEATNRSIIFLTGSSVVKYFTGLEISKVSSLILPSEFFPNAVVIAAPSISTIFSDVGEFRLAMTTLKQEVTRYHDER